MNNHINIRQATLADAAIITEFNVNMALETENKQLDQHIVLKGVNNLIETPENGFYLVAEKDNKILGSLMITTEWSDWRNGDFWWIQSVYVKPEERRQGVYSSLYDSVTELAKSIQSVCGIRLYVEQNNSTAQQTYESLGMKASHYLVYEADLK